MTLSSVPASTFDVVATRKDAHAFRGSVLNSYSRFEMALTSLLESARLHADYAAIARTPPHLLSQKMDMLAKLSQAEGAWKAKLTPAVTQLQAIRPYDELRNLLSHGALKVAQSENQEVLYLFTMLRPGPGGLQRVQHAFTAAEADKLRIHINRLANNAVQTLGKVADKSPATVTMLSIPA